MLGDIFMKCPKCRLHNSNSAKFCNECGFDFRSIDHLSAHTFGHRESYTPQHLIDKILTSRSSIEGERKYVTVMFVDVANSTSIFENLDPEAVHQIMDGCFQIFLDEVHKYEGTINQFRGDCVMAIFGAPIAHEDHAQRACHAALGIIGAIKDYCRVVEQKHQIAFKVRIGLNTGPVVVGSIGNDLRMDYTADGDTTNLASRMESNAKQGTILISPNTYKLIDKLFKTRSLGKISLKGKKDPLNVYELLGEKVYRQRVGIERRIYSEMVGREDEILRLQRQVEKLINGSGSVVNIIGEAGIGKSRLVAELKNHDVMEKVTLLEGKAISIGKNLSFYPIIDLLKQWAGIKEEDGQVTAFEKLEASINALKTGQTEILPFIATLMRIKLSGEYAQRVKGIEGEALENLLFKNLRELLIQIAKYSPVVVVIEDLHWADLSSIGFIESIFHLAQSNPILFINPMRPGYEQTTEPLITTLNEDLEEYYLEMTLAPLDAVSSEVMIDNMLNFTGLPVSLINRIVERADGNPYFIEEVVRSFIDEGVLVVKDGIFESTDKIHQVVIPNTINGLLTARIDRLEDKNRELLKIASVIGRNFFYRILKNVAESGLDIDKRLAYLKNIQMISERQRLKEIEYLFKHALTQEAAYESILMEKRKPLHLKVAQSIEKVFSNKLNDFYGILSFHYTKGEDFFKAEEYLIKSGEEALKSSASSEAVTFFREALGLYQNRLGENADPDKIAYMQKCIALAYYNRGQMMESTEYFGNVLSHYGVKTPKNIIYSILLALSSFVWFIADLYIPFLRSKRVAGRKDNEVIELWFRRANAFAVSDRVMFLKESFRFYKKVLKYDLKTVDNGIPYLRSAGGVFVYSGISFALGKKVLDRLKSELDEDDPKDILYYSTFRMMHDFFSGNFARKITFDEDLVQQNLELGDIVYTTYYFNQYIFQYIEKGNFSETIELIRKELEIIETYRCDFSKSLLLSLNARLLLKMRKLDEALITADSAIAYAKKAGDLIVLSQIHSYKARIQLLSGNIEGAEQSLENAEKIKSEMMLPFYLVEMYLSRFVISLYKLEQISNSENKDLSLECSRKALKSGKITARITKKVVYNSVELFRYMGIYHWITNKQRKALRYWSKSITEGERMDVRPELARTYFEVGIRLLDQTSEQTELNGIEAEEYLNKARNIFEDLGLQWDLEQLERFSSNT